MNNPNICNFYGASVSDPKNSYFVFSFSPRGSLDVSLNRSLHSEPILLNCSLQFSRWIGISFSFDHLGYIAGYIIEARPDFQDFLHFRSCEGKCFSFLENFCWHRVVIVYKIILRNFYIKIQRLQKRINESLHYTLYHTFANFLQGIGYLHESILRTHGNLKPQNCLIDARWTLKITDYGLYNLRIRLPVDERNEDVDRYFRGLNNIIIINKNFNTIIRRLLVKQWSKLIYCSILALFWKFSDKRRNSNF